MKKNYLQKNFSIGLLGLLFITSGANAQTTDKYRIWAKDANVLHNYYYWDSPVTVTSSGTNFAIPTENGVNQGVNYAWNNCFLKFENVDFGTYSDSLIFLRNVPRGAIIEFWIDRIETTRFDTFFNDGGYTTTGNKNVIDLSGGKFLGSYQHWYNKDGNWSRWETQKIAINKTGGVHTLYVLFRAGGKTETNQTVGGLYYIDLKRTFGDVATALTSDETTLEIPVGKHNLQVSLTPSTASKEDLVWTVESQSEPGVLNVSDGTIIAMKAGTATVKCISSRAAGDVSLTYNVTVVGTSTVAVNKVEAETADTLYNTYNPVAAQTFAKGSLDGEFGGGNNQGLIYTWNTNFAIYRNIDFGSFTDSIKFRHAEIRGGAVEFWIDRDIIGERHSNRLAAGDYFNPSGKETAGGKFLGRYEFLKENGFLGNDKWAEFQLPIVPVSGKHDLYVVFLRGGKGTFEKTTGHYDWFKLDRKVADIYQIIPSCDLLELKKGEEKTVALTIVPEVVYNKDVTWSVEEGGDRVSVDNTGKITGIVPGTAKIKVTSNANSNVYAEIGVTVTDMTSGVSNSDLEFTYNNPVSENLYIHSNAAIRNIIITNLSGRVIYKNGNVINREFSLNCSYWTPGSYFVTIKTALNTKVLKITKQ